MSSLLVSIIVPTYNRANFIVETLDSIANQDYENIELIVIDDGSTDNTSEVVQQWFAQFKSRFTILTYHLFNVNKGKSAAVNYGYNLFHGDYVMVFDSDDILLPNAISSLLHFFNQHPLIDALCAGAYALQGNVKTNELLHAFQETSYFENINEYYGDLLLKGNAIIASTVLLKKNVVQELGGYKTELRYTHDWEYWIRVSQKFVFGFVNLPIVYYRVNSDGASSANKYGTFIEIYKILRLYNGIYNKQLLRNAILYQIKANARLAYLDKKWYQVFKILCSGGVLLFKFIFIDR